MQQPRKWPELNLKSPGIKARTGRLPAPLHVVTSNIRLHDSSADTLSHELPETPPHGPHLPTVPQDHSVFAPVMFPGMYAIFKSLLTIIIIKFKQKLLEVARNIKHK